jgi:adrenodoxin-NADP+ reductase
MAAVMSRRALACLFAAARPRGGAPFASPRDAPLRWLSSAAKDLPARDPRLFCVVGSGPAGMYAADRLLTHYGASARVDILDKSPVPFGLVRSGVAPDHASTKSVVNRFEGVLSDPRVCFFGNAALGRDVSVDDLTPRYHAVVLAYGATGDRTLDVPGEDTLRGAISARRFVGWFNGDPEAHGDDVEISLHGAKNLSLHDEITACLTQHRDVSHEPCTHDDTAKDRSKREMLSNGDPTEIEKKPATAEAPTAVIFGLGNVALDCARILLRDARDLRETDICAAALATLERSEVKKVALIGRRGVAQAAFSPKELRELLNLPDVDVRVYDDEVTEADEADLEASRPRRRAREAIEKRKARGNDENEIENVEIESGTRRKNRKELSVRFLRSPSALVARDDDATRLGSVILEMNELRGPPGSRRAVGTGATETIRNVALALRSVGYRSKPLEEHFIVKSTHEPDRFKQSVPFDAARGVVPNAFGRVTHSVAPAMGGGEWQVPGLYVVGWLKRGPRGIIGDNLIDAEETVGALVADDARGMLRKPDYRFKDRGVAPLLEARKKSTVSKEGWRRIDAEERRRGAEAGKPREKITSVLEMLRVANEGG